MKKAGEEEFLNLVKQVYRVLLTRGMKGCYVFFDRADTRDFFVSRVKARLGLGDHFKSGQRK